MQKYRTVLNGLLLGILPFLFVPVVYSDSIQLKDGRTIEGQLLSVTADQVEILTRGVKIKVPRKNVQTPDLARLFGDARAAFEKGDAAAADDLCRQILMWDPQFSGAESLGKQAAAARGKMDAQAAAEKARAEAEAKTLAEQEALTAEQKEREKAERDQQRRDQEWADMKVRMEKLQETRAFLAKGDLEDAKRACQEILDKTPLDREATELLVQIRKAAKAKEEKTARTGLGDPMDIVNPDAKAAYLEIQKKLAEINEYSCVLNGTQTIESPERKLESTWKEERFFRRPNLYTSIRTEIKSFRSGGDLSMTVSVVDGANYWRFTQNAKGSGETLLNSQERQMSEREKAEFIQRWEQPHLYKCDIKRLEEGGGSVDEVVDYLLLRPFRWCRFSTLELVSQDAATWVLRAQGAAVEPGADPGWLVLTFNKNNGTLVKREMLGGGKGTNNAPKIESTWLFKDVKVNPGLSDDKFVATLPPGVPAQDVTDSYIPNK